MPTSETYIDLPVYRLEDLVPPRLVIVELDNGYRIDTASGKRLAYFYWDTAAWPLPGGQSKEEAERVARVCLYALGAEKDGI